MMECRRQIVCGEMHYPRIPHEYWRARLAMARAMGLNAVSTYVFWNRHEPRPGVYDFAGENDIARFIRLAQEEDLLVIVRPGPYVCAEWEFGGLPAWLLKDGEIPVRSNDPRFIEPAARWLLRLGDEIASLQSAHGGPILAVQLENEYGAFGEDRAYLQGVRNALARAGLDASFLYTIDQPGDLARGSLSDVPIAVTFAPGDPGTQFARVHELRPDGPLLCGEYWAGWFDHWGEPRAKISLDVQANDLEWMLERGISVNVYMFHGGTNFGFWNGANAFEPQPYQPTTTSYDYQAALDETGTPTSKYHRFREIIVRHTRVEAPPIPQRVNTIDLPPVTLDECASLFDTLGEPVERADPVPMEALDQSLGFILYRTRLDAEGSGRLTIDDVRDYAVVMLDGEAVGHLDRRLGQRDLVVQARRGSRLDILVENCGRINYGPRFPGERKGLVGSVRWEQRELRGWQIYCLPFERVEPAAWTRALVRGPAFFRGTFDVEPPADTFLDTSDLRKGALWINGRNLGRFWDVGPQRSLYVPGVWLRSGCNEAVALDLFERRSFPTLRSYEHMRSAP